MPAAREALLTAALSAIGDLPWTAVRMVDVASAAGVSRQTLYNEFGGKEGLARALVRREADHYLLGVERLLAQRGDAGDRLVSVAEWTVGEAAARPVLRALLTGCWGDRLPAPRAARSAPADLVALVRDRSAAALDPEPPDHCELAVRLALAQVVAPADEPVGRLVRSAMAAAPVAESVAESATEAVSAPSPRAADR